MPRLLTFLVTRKSHTPALRPWWHCRHLRTGSEMPSGPAGSHQTRRFRGSATCAVQGLLRMALADLGGAELITMASHPCATKSPYVMISLVAEGSCCVEWNEADIRPGRWYERGLADDSGSVAHTLVCGADLVSDSAC
ncbi:hypothetical protein Micbo1qcDRAFT_6804 [Microdochium bolleyi]|uniref:Uncharacterized protein n=1 Tax=Microdochium bolleyi TaxID=196109 RepID=A0A136JJE8_9PEZI|nr:hypothetical protein Micbo1qcDRAFT_6804 [Microdochium bolleyi]